MRVDGVRACPFCGSLRLSEKSIGNTAFIRCDECGAHGPHVSAQSDSETMEELHGYACYAWQERDYRATMDAYEFGSSSRCPFCGCTRNTTSENLKERGTSTTCDACRARGPLIESSLDDRGFRDSKVYFQRRDHLTARRTLGNKVII